MNSLIACSFKVIKLTTYTNAGRLYTVQKGMELDRASPEGKKFLAALLQILEKVSSIVLALPPRLLSIAAIYVFRILFFLSYISCK